MPKKLKVTPRPVPVEPKPVETNFSKVKTGDYFTASDGEKYKKTSELTFDDSYGLEHYMDPLFDKKIGAPLVTPKSIDTSARVVKEEFETKISVKKTPKSPKPKSKKVR